MVADTDQIFNQFKAKISKAKTQSELEKIKIEYLGRKRGIIARLTEKIPSLPIAERKGLGTNIKKLKRNLEGELKLMEQRFSKTAEEAGIDYTTPGNDISYGTLHPLTQVMWEVQETFHYLGFSWLDGPEVDTEEYNFDKLNMSPDHPSRDPQQTYYLEKNLLLRTHTSNMQVRFLEKNKPPVRVLFPGRAYRRDMPDATHLPSFYQIEGLLVDQHASLSDLIGVLKYFTKKLFGDGSKIRVYGHNFPYTEPSIEVEVFHEKRGWIEILGAGMVHPQVIKNAGLDSKKYRGWAFGMGPDRLVMLKYGVDDVRLLYKNDIKFLKQF